jgi:hypothetical protein
MHFGEWSVLFKVFILSISCVGSLGYKKVVDYGGVTEESYLNP